LLRDHTNCDISQQHAAPSREPGGRKRIDDGLPASSGGKRMTTAGIAIGQLSEAEHGRQLRRAIVASTVGTIIEAYDFLLYVLVAPLVFAKLFFPESDPLVGILQAFGIYAVGFIARPIGAALFGHYGDRIGRKTTLIATLLLTGLSTSAVGFVPGYDSIGIWGAIILTTFRFIQGLGIGGEWGGATLMAMEWARTNAHRGFITSWPQWAVRPGCSSPTSRCSRSARSRVTSF
jgi:Sugar (and other) transporter